MRKAICPQPDKRFFFINEKNKNIDKCKNFFKILSFSAAILIITGMSANALAETLSSGFPALNVSTNGDTTEYSFPLQILLLMTALTVLPSLVLGMTSFTRIIIVMSILRQALGTQQTPPNQVLIAISLFLTFFIMAPTFEVIYSENLSPLLDGAIQLDSALEGALLTLKKFMVANTHSDTLNLFVDLSNS